MWWLNCWEEDGLTRRWKLLWETTCSVSWEGLRRWGRETHTQPRTVCVFLISLQAPSKKTPGLLWFGLHIHAAPHTSWLYPQRGSPLILYIQICLLAPGRTTQPLKTVIHINSAMSSVALIRSTWLSGFGLGDISNRQLQTGDVRFERRGC